MTCFSNINTDVIDKTLTMLEMYAQHQDPETEVAKYCTAIIHLYHWHLCSQCLQ